MVLYYNGLELDGSSPYMFIDFDGVLNALNREAVYVGKEPLTELKMIARDPKDWNVEVYDIDNELHYAPTSEGKAVLNNRTYIVQWSAEMVHDLNEILALGKITPIILSTWRQVGAEEVMPLIGLNVPASNWLDFGDSTLNAYEAGKLMALENLYLGLKREGNPTPSFVWIDDNATNYFHNLNNPAEQKLAQEFGAPSSLIVKPKARKGISRYEMTRIREFVEAL